MRFCYSICLLLIYINKSNFVYKIEHNLAHFNRNKFYADLSVWMHKLIYLKPTAKSTNMATRIWMQYLYSRNILIRTKYYITPKNYWSKFILWQTIEMWRNSDSKKHATDCAIYFCEFVRLFIQASEHMRLLYR